MTGPTFWLGTHMPSWLRDETLPPLMVSHRRLKRYKRLPEAQMDWVCDSGGFTELSMYGQWQTEVVEYVDAVSRYSEEVGRMTWAAPQDWMCEPFITAKTGLSVRAHQERTCQSVAALRQLAPELPWIPVLQGWAPDDYLYHVTLYERFGIDLLAEDVVGLGSVCRRQALGEAEHIVQLLQPIALHGFGMKTEAWGRYGSLLASADSLAWSAGGRNRAHEDCPHATCGNCKHFALEWRENLMNPRKPSLFGA